MNFKAHFLTHLKQLFAVAALVAFLAGCGVDHSPMAATEEAAPPPAVQAAKKAKNTTDTTTDDGSKVTSKKGNARYSLGGRR